jgi:hypothetical protein
MLVQKMDEEDGVSLSHTNDMKESPKDHTPLVDPAFLAAADRANAQSQASKEEVKEEVKPEAPVVAPAKKGTEIDEDGDGVMDGLDFDGDGTLHTVSVSMFGVMQTVTGMKNVLSVVR